MQVEKPCAFCRRNLSSYIDGELPLALVPVVETHLATCPNCRMEYEELSLVMNALAALQAPEPPHDLDIDVLERITRKGTGNYLARLIPASLCATVLGLFLGTFLANGVIPQRTDDPLLVAGDGIIQEMDVLSPFPKGSFGNIYLTMFDNPDKYCDNLMKIPTTTKPASDIFCRD